MGVFEQTLRWRRWKSRATGAWIAAVLALQFAALVVFWPARAAAPQPSVTAPFTDASFQALLAHDPMTGQPVDTVQALLPLLPRALRTNFTLVYDSRSPFKDQITPASPRVILFSDDARFVLTFIGDPAAPGHDLLETMSFDDAAAEFKLSAYVLPAARRAGWSPSAEAANCAGCHGADARPIYDSYPLWPGFYGSVLDTFFRDKIGQAELKKYRAFLAGPAKTGVYRALVFRPGSPTSPYLDPSRARKHSVEVSPKAFPFLPNTRLGMALTELNRVRIYRKLAAAPGFAAHEKDILAELLECPEAPRPSRERVRAIQTALDAENGARLKRLGGQPNDPAISIFGMEELKFVHALAEIDDVAARAGADRTDWSMALEPKSAAYFDGILSGMVGQRSYYLKEDLIYELLAHLDLREPAFIRYSAEYSAFADQGYPFGNRPYLDLAIKGCALLTGVRGGRAA
jgi:cytochrome c553